MRTSFIAVLACVLSVAAHGLILAEGADSTPGKAVWPAEDWAMASPVEEGMDSDLLDAALSHAMEKSSTGVVIIRGGRIVAERYSDSGGPGKRMAMYSATKSVVSVLVGIAIDEGYIKSVDQKASDFLTEWKGTPKEAITIRHHLSMTSGLEDKTPFVPFLSRSNEARYAMGLDLDHEPGKVWYYHNHAYHLLFTILHRATGRPIDQYSQEKLLGPLGMKDTGWKARKSKEADNFQHMESTCRDMARFGLMVLRNGEWNGKRIVSENFLKQSLASSQEMNRSYGWLWWLNGKASHMLPLKDKVVQGMICPDCPPDAFAALGAADKLIMIVPSLDLVVTRLGGRTGGFGDVGRGAFASGLLYKVCFSVKAWKGGVPRAMKDPPGPETSIEAFEAALSGMQHARVIGDVEEFRRCASEAARMWHAFPPEVRDRLEKDYPGIGERVEKGFE